MKVEFQVPAIPGKACLQSVGGYWETLKGIAESRKIPVEVIDDRGTKFYFVDAGQVEGLKAAYAATQVGYQAPATPAPAPAKVPTPQGPGPAPAAPVAKAGGPPA